MLYIFLAFIEIKENIRFYVNEIMMNLLEHTFIFIAILFLSLAFIFFSCYLLFPRDVILWLGYYYNLNYIFFFLPSQD